MYAVFLCRGKGETYQKFSSQRFDDFVREPGGDKDYGYVVVRQQTTGTGYHTTDSDVRRLYDLIKRRLLTMGG
jgi:hypothetical protein